MDVRVGLYRKLSDKELMLLKWCWILLKLPWTARRSNQSILKEINLNIRWKDCCWSWNSNTLATWCEELTHLKRRWCWETLKVGGEGDNRGWDGWMASPTQWTWVWVSSGSCWWTGKPGMLQSMGLQRFGHDWVTELSCYVPTILSYFLYFLFFFLSHWKLKLSVLWQIYSKIIQYVCL